MGLIWFHFLSEIRSLLVSHLGLQNNVVTYKYASDDHDQIFISLKRFKCFLSKHSLDDRSFNRRFHFCPFLLLCVYSAFFWLIGLLAASVIWYAVVPLRDQLAFGLVNVCLFQEVMRFLFYFLVSKAEYSLQKMVEAEAQVAIHSNHPRELDVAVRSANGSAKHGSIFDHRTLAFTSGLSFALMAGIIEYVYIFDGVIGPGTLLEGSNPGYFFIFAGLTSFFMGLLQISWSIILFRAFHLRLYIDIVVVCATHVALSALTLLNDWSHPAPELVCVTTMIAAFGFNAYAFFAAGGRLLYGANSPPRSINSAFFVSPATTTI